MITYSFVQNTKILAGPGSIANIGEVVKSLGYSKVLLIHGGNIRRSGIADKVAASLEAAGLEHCSFENVKSDPPAELVDEAAEFARGSGCDCVVAIGGGSAIDMGKAVNMLRFNEGHALEYLAKPHVHSPGLIAVPTTSGTGAELSTGSVITDTQNNMKLPLPVQNAMPEVAILDPELTASMPPKMTMLTGLDAFSHAVEGYCNVMSTMTMDPICEKIMEMIVENLPVAVADGSNIPARAGMQMAACMSGWSLTNVYANVGHSLAHVVGANLHLIHGAACAYGLPGVLKYMSPAVPGKVKRIGQYLGAEFTGSETPAEIGEKAAEAYKAFCAKLGLTPVTEENLGPVDLDLLAELVVHEPFAQLTPVPVDHAAAKALLAEMLQVG